MLHHEVGEHTFPRTVISIYLSIYLSSIRDSKQWSERGASIARGESRGARAESLARVFFGRKVSLAKRSSERLKLGTLNFVLLGRTAESEPSEAFVRTSHIVGQELGTLNFELLLCNWTFQSFTLTLTFTVLFELWNFNLNFSILN